MTIAGNTTLKRLSNGTHTLVVYANDSAGNQESDSVTFDVDIVVAEETTDINTTNESGLHISYVRPLGNVSVELDLATFQDIDSDTINITTFQDAPVVELNETTGVLSGKKAARKYVKVNASSNIYSNISWVMLRVYYTDDDLVPGHVENTLRLYWHNESGGNWVKLSKGLNLTSSGGPYVYDTGVNKSGRYVWANITSFSYYGIAGEVDSDGDGIYDSIDSCPNEAGPASNSGCPVTGGSSGGRGGGTPPKPEIVLLANSIDYSPSINFIAFLKNNDMDVIYVNAQDFSKYKTEKFIVILGGPDSYEGVGEIVQEVLDDTEAAFLRTLGNHRMYVNVNVWRTGQVVLVIAGSGREFTRESTNENQAAVVHGIKYS